MSFFVPINKGERTKVILSAAQSFCMGFILAIYYIASTSYFFTKYDSLHLPFAFAASGALGLAVWLIYTKFQRIISFNTLSGLSLLFLMGTNIFFGSFVNSSSPPSHFYFSFIFIRIISFMSAIVLWGHLGRIYNLQEGKRLFGFIGLWEVFAGMVGFFSLRYILPFTEVRHLFTLCALVYGAWLAIFLTSTAVYGKSAPKQSTQKNERSGTSKISWDEIFTNPYYLILFCLVLLPVLIRYFVEYLFLEQANLNLATELPVFLAGFFGIAQLLLLIVKMFISGPLLQKMGIKTGLLGMPVLLGLVTALSCAVLTIENSQEASFIGIFFVLIQLNCLFERVLRGSVAEPSFQVMYQPISKSKRNNIRLKIEGVPKALATMAAGFVLYILLIFGNNETFIFAFVLLILLGIWIILAQRGYHLYKNRLRQAIDASSDAVTAPEQNGGRQTYFDIKNTPIPASIKKISLGLKLFPNNAPAYMPAWLSDRRPEIQKYIKKKFPEFDRLDLKQLEHSLLESNPNFSNSPFMVRIKHLTRRYAKEVVIERLHSKDPQIRLKGVRLIRSLPDQIQKREISRLMSDPDIDVLNTAIRACGKLNWPNHWTHILQHLSQPETANASIDSCIAIGEPIVPDLELLYEKTGNDNVLLQRTIHIYASIGGDLCVSLLWKKVGNSDPCLLVHLLSALSSLNARADGGQKEKLKKVLINRAKFCTWLLSAIRDIQKKPSGHDLEKDLQRDLVRNQELIFTLLSLMYDKKTISFVKQAFSPVPSSQIQAGDPEKSQFVTVSSMFALELMATLFKGDIAKWLPHLLDNSSIHQKLNLLQEFFPTNKLSFEMRLIDIIHKSYADINIWTKFLAVQNLAKSSLSDAQRELNGLLFSSHAAMRKFAQNQLQLLSQLKGNGEFDPNSPEDSLQKMYRAPSVRKYEAEWWESELIQTGFKSRFFKPCQIAYAAKYVKTVTLNPGEVVNMTKEHANPFCIIAQGRLQVLNGGTYRQHIHPNTLFHCREGLDDVRFEALDNCIIGILHSEIFYSLLRDNKALINLYLDNIPTNYES